MYVVVCASGEHMCACLDMCIGVHMHMFKDMYVYQDGP